LRYFLKVADTGGLSPAARVLGVNTATVGRHIEALENGLGQRLFERTPQGYRLTNAGKRLFEWSRRVEAEFTGIQMAFGSGSTELTGTVSIATTDWVAVPFLIPTLVAFRHKHPAIDLVVAGSMDPVNLSRREADVALRLFRPEQGNLVVRRVGDIGHGLYASKTYLQAHGAPDLATGCAGHNLIDWPPELETVPTVTWLRRHAGKARAVLRGNVTIRLAATRAGLGFSLLACIAAASAPELVRLDVEPAPPAIGLWLAAHADLAQLPRIRAVIDHIAAAAEERAAFLRGEADA
jgi:DNA-binding transcriptional LysR family regulator